MIKKYSVTYKIKKDYPETDLEGKFDIYAYTENSAKCGALIKIKEKFPGINNYFTDDELLNFMHIEFEYNVNECVLCWKILEPEDLNFFEVNVSKAGEIEKHKMTFCSECWFSLLEEIESRKFAPKIKNE
jgi:hypothetical protein